MQAIRYRITSLSPLLFASNTGDPNMVATLDYIPGTSLRGMFANEYIKRKHLGAEAHKDDTFYRWFLKGELKITNAYIVQYDNGRVYRLLPIPISIQREKGDEGTAYDLLLQDEELGIPTVGITGYGRLDGDLLYKKEVKKSLNFHHARDRVRGVAKMGLIFNYESIDEGQTFEGYIIGKSEDLKVFNAIISDGIYHIGRSRNNQYGKIRFEIVNKEPVEFHSEINLEEDSEDDIILTFLSDTIIYNEHGYSTTDIRDLEKELNCKIKRAFIKQSEEEGFISVWKLKTPSEVSFKAGSCFLLENPDIKRLKELQKTGIGMKTHEGFGRFVFYWQGSTRLKLIKAKDEIKVSKPQRELTEDLKKLLQNILKEYIKKQIQIKAIKEAGDFNKLPSKSLLAKIESSVRDKSFKNLMINLKRTARDKLERCRNKDKDLYEYLTEFSIQDEEITEIIKSTKGMERLCNEISYQPREVEFKEELEKIYLITFLSTMRKKAKQNGGK